MTAGTVNRLRKLTTSSLVVKLKQGDEDVKGVLYERYLPWVTRLANQRMSNLKGVYDPEDAAQESLLKALEKVDRFEGDRPGAYRAFVITILRNRIIDLARRAKRSPFTASEAAVAPDSGRSALSRVIIRQKVASYRSAMAALSDKNQNLLKARLEHEMTFEEIATETGLRSADAARIAFRRALERLVDGMRTQGVESANV